MKLRDKIDSIDREISMLSNSIWFIMKKLDIEPSDIIKAQHAAEKAEELRKLKKKAEELGVKVA